MKSNRNKIDIKQQLNRNVRNQTEIKYKSHRKV